MQGQLRGDPLLGTAFPAGQVLLVEQPGPWGRSGLPESRFDRRTALSLIAAQDRVGVRVLAIRRPGRGADDGTRRWAFADCRPSRESLRWGRFTDDRGLLSLDVSAAGQGTPDQAPMYLVCAHGTHDVCCAVRGRPVAAALERERPNRVWECSHVGGDRFAANVLVLPSGVLYGSIPVTGVAAMADASDRGQVLTEHLRGRIGFPPEVQAAMAFAQEQDPGRPFGALTVVSVERVADRDVVVRLTRAGRLYNVRVAAEQAAPHQLTCAAKAPLTVRNYRPSWADVDRAAAAG